MVVFAFWEKTLLDRVICRNMKGSDVQEVGYVVLAGMTFTCVVLYCNAMA